MTARHIPSHLIGIQYQVETSFGTAAGTVTSILRAENIEFKPGLSAHGVKAQKTSDMRGPDSSIMGGKGGTLSFDLPLHTMGGSESPAVTLMAKCAGSKVSVAAGSGTATGGSANTIVFLDASVGNIAVGTAIMHNSAAGTDSIRFVERVQASTPGAGSKTVTVNSNWATAATSGDGWTAIDTITPSSGEPADYLTFNVYQGHGATDRLKWALTGCAGTWKLNTAEADSLPTVHFEYSVDTWADSEANLAQTDFSGNEASPLLGDSLYIDGTAVATKSIGFDPGLQLHPIKATSGTNGREGWFYSNTQPKLEILPRHDTDLITKWEAGTDFDVLFESTQSNTNGWALWVPAAQIQSLSLGDDDGLLRSTMEIIPTDPGANADDALIPLWAIAVTK